MRFEQLNNLQVGDIVSNHWFGINSIKLTIICKSPNPGNEHCLIVGWDSNDFFKINLIENLSDYSDIIKFEEKYNKKYKFYAELGIVHIHEVVGKIFAAEYAEEEITLI